MHYVKPTSKLQPAAFHFVPDPSRQLASEALEAEAAGITAADRDLEKCRQLIRMAEKASAAAALDPLGSSPVARRREVPATTSRERLSPQPATARTAGSGRGAAIASPPVSMHDTTAQAGWRKGEAGIATAKGHPCNRCGEPSSDCRCGTISQTGRWMRQGRSIIVVNC
jgi:hypothetical protein